MQVSGQQPGVEAGVRPSESPWLLFGGEYWEARPAVGKTCFSTGRGSRLANSKCLGQVNWGLEGFRCLVGFRPYHGENEASWEDFFSDCKYQSFYGFVMFFNGNLKNNSFTEI